MTSNPAAQRWVFSWAMNKWRVWDLSKQKYRLSFQNRPSLDNSTTVNWLRIEESRCNCNWKIVQCVHRVMSVSAAHNTFQSRKCSIQTTTTTRCQTRDVWRCSRASATETLMCKFSNTTVKSPPSFFSLMQHRSDKTEQPLDFNYSSSREQLFISFLPA